MLKSQDILVLLKLIVLQRAHQNKARRVSDELPAKWHGWEMDGGDAMEPGGFDPAPPAEDPFSVRSLARALGLSKSEISHSLRRSLGSGLVIRARESGKPQPNAKALHELIVYGLKYVFPVQLGQLGRGIPTGVDAPVFDRLLYSAGEHSYVWPDPQGNAKGQSVEPLYRSVPHAVRLDADLYAILALVDAIRLGRPRESAVAAKELKGRLGLK